MKIPIIIVIHMVTTARQDKVVKTRVGAFRPSQIRASAEETAMMIPQAFDVQKHYGELKMPIDL